MSETRTGADLFVETLEQYDVNYVFGNPGTTELPVMNALSGSDLEYVLALHEDIAVGMASGYASTRRYHAHDDSKVNPAGVVNLHITPGLAHGLGNIYAASFTGSPLVVTAGNHSTDFRHEEPLLSGELKEMTRQFCKWSDEVLDVRALPTMLRRAFRVALTPPTGPVFLGLPLDVMMAETEGEPERMGTIPNAGTGDPAQIKRVTDLLVEADNPVMIVGDHVARSGKSSVNAAIDLAEAVGARVHGEILACEVNFPTDHELWSSYVIPDEDLARMQMSADTLILVGCSTNTTLTRYEEALIGPETTCIHISDASWEIGKNQTADAAVIGDPGLVMSAITEAVQEQLDESVRQSRLKNVQEEKRSIAESLPKFGESRSPDDPRATKAELVDELMSVVDDPFIVDEGITSKYALLTRAPLQPEQFISNKGGGLGYGLPAAVGAAIAEEENDSSKDVIGFIGDGSYLYYPHTIYTAARYGVDLTVVIPDNRNYRILKNNMIDMLGGEEDDYNFVGMDFEPPVDFITNVSSHGGSAELVESPDEIAQAIENAQSSEGVSVVDVLVQD